MLLKHLSPEKCLSLLFCLCLAGCASAPLEASDPAPPRYQLNYLIKLVPGEDRAVVTMTIEPGKMVRQLKFDNPDGKFFAVEANGNWREESGELWWDLPDGKAVMTVSTRITHRRNEKGYDAFVTEDWALFRGDDIVPNVSTQKELPGAMAEAELDFELPDDWSIETGWVRLKDNRFRIDNPERRFDRPIGWMLAGDLGTRRDRIQGTSVAVSAPKGSGFQRMDVLVFLNIVWRQYKSAFDTLPEKLLIVGGDDPLWRGGLSAPNSFYLHADRPIVSENGTSPLLHELFHMVTRIRGAKNDETNDDWIAEGLAEYYSVELLHRAKGLNNSRKKKVIRRLARWGKDVTYLRGGRSHGKITARAVVWFDQLADEIEAESKGEYALDDVVRQLMVKREVSLEDLQASTEQLMGKRLKAFDDPLLTEKKKRS